MRGALLAVVAVAGATLLLAAAGSPRGIKEGGTFRVGAPDGGGFGSIEPAVGGGSFLTAATCAGLMRFPDKPLPEGFRVVPDLATAYPKVKDGSRTYAFTIRKDARFSTGAGVTARSFAHTINRLLSPRMDSPFVEDYADIVGARKVIDGKAESASGIVAR